LKALGAGTYASVAAFSAPRAQPFAVKKLREVRLLAHFKHPNLLSIQDVFLEAGDFRDVYLCLEMMDGDLHQLIYESSLMGPQMQWVIYQVMRGLLCLKTAQVLHRDLKPGNVFVRANGDVKIADLGLARAVDAEGDERDEQALTEYVVTRYYRAPEVVLTAMRYTYAVDMWSAGCILGEMLGRRPLFQGKDSLDQIRQIILCIGAQTAEDIEWLGPSGASRKFVEMCNQASDGHAFRRLSGAPGSNPLAAALLAQMLRFDPSRRIAVDDCLRHPYLEEFAADSDPEVLEARALRPVDWAFDRDLGAVLESTARPQCVDAFREAFAQARCLVAAGGASVTDVAGAISVDSSCAGRADARAGDQCGMAAPARAPAVEAKEGSPQRRWGRRWRCSNDSQRHLSGDAD